MSKVICIVDDQPALLQMLRFALNFQGLTVIEVDGDIDIFSIGGGYFLTDVVELTFDFANVDFGGGDTNVFGLGGKYYFPMGENSLYAGGGFQTIDAFGGDGDVLFVTGGYNYMLKDYFSIDFYLTLGQGDINGDDFDMTDLGVTYSIYFK